MSKRNGDCDFVTEMRVILNFDFSLYVCVVAISLRQFQLHSKCMSIVYAAQLLSYELIDLSLNWIGFNKFGIT